MQAETETAPATPVRAAITLAPVTVAELSAHVSTLAIAGGGPANVAMWERLVTFVPWFALATGRTLLQVYEMPVDAYVIGLRDNMGSLVDGARADASAEALGRAAAILGATS